MTATLTIGAGANFFATDLGLIGGLTSPELDGTQLQTFLNDNSSAVNRGTEMWTVNELNSSQIVVSETDGSGNKFDLVINGTGLGLTMGPIPAGGFGSVFQDLTGTVTGFTVTEDGTASSTGVTGGTTFLSSTIGSSSWTLSTPAVGGGNLVLTVDGTNLPTTPALIQEILHPGEGAYSGPSITLSSIALTDSNNASAGTAIHFVSGSGTETVTVSNDIGTPILATSFTGTFGDTFSETELDDLFSGGVLDTSNFFNDTLTDATGLSLIDVASGLPVATLAGVSLTTSGGPDQFLTALAGGTVNASATSTQFTVELGNAATLLDNGGSGDFALGANDTQILGFSGGDFDPALVIGSLNYNKAIFDFAISDYTITRAISGVTVTPIVADSTIGSTVVLQDFQELDFYAGGEGAGNTGFAEDRLEPPTPDFFGTGRSGIVWRNTVTGAFDLWQMQGNTVISSGSVVSGGVNVSLPTTWEVATFGNFNTGDFADIVLRNTVTEQTVVWDMNGTSIVDQATIGAPSGDWLLLRSANFSGSGTNDILWQDTVSGQIALWDMSNLSVTGSAIIGNLSSSWKFEGSGVFNTGNSSTQDILWVNTATGQVAVWNMTAGTVSSSAIIETLSGIYQAQVGNFFDTAQAGILVRNRVTGEVDVDVLAANGLSIASTTDIGTLVGDWKPVASGDFLGNDISDILWIDPANGQGQLWEMDSTLAPTVVSVATPSSVGWFPDTQSVTPSPEIKQDFFGTGNASVLFENESNGEVALWQMNGTALVNSFIVTSLSTNWQIQGIGDFNGDGYAGILWQNTATGQTAIWDMLGTTIASSALISSPPSPWQVAGVGDFNGDGSADILWRNATSGQTAVFLMNGSSIIGSAIIGTLSSAWKVAGVGDFNGDGDADILWQNTSTGQIAIWEMNGTSVASSEVIATLGTQWQVQGVGDFNGDGMADILFENTATSQVAVWEMNGYTVTTSAVIATLPGWTVENVADYAGTGMAGILWQNNTTGALAVWEMNGTSIVASGEPGSVPNPPWQVGHNPVLAV